MPHVKLAFCPPPCAKSRDLTPCAVAGPPPFPKSEMVLNTYARAPAPSSASPPHSAAERSDGIAAPNNRGFNHARGHFHRTRRPHRGPLSPGAAEECADRHRAPSASAVRRHDEPSDHLSALLRLRAPRTFPPCASTFAASGAARAASTTASANSPTPPPRSTGRSRSTPRRAAAGSPASRSAPGSACSS